MTQPLDLSYDLPVYNEINSNRIRESDYEHVHPSRETESKLDHGVDMLS